MKQCNYSGLFCLSVISFFMACHNNPEAGEAIENRPERVIQQDSQFVVDAYSEGLLEIEISDHVKNMVNRTELRDIAEMMMIAHEVLNERLKNLAASKHVALPEGLTEHQSEEIFKNDTKSGSEFDKAFLDKLIIDHKNTIDFFKRASKEAKDKDVRHFFTAALPEINAHLDWIKGARDSIL